MSFDFRSVEILLLCWHMLYRYEDYDAAENFMQVLSVPGHALSAIAVAAYKKAALVAVLATGKKLIPPKYISATVVKAAKGSKNYDV